MTDTKDDRARLAEGAHTAFAGEMSYGDYLALDAVLTAQHPRSTSHNELLFIVQHQTTELWMKLIIHELTAARDALRNDDLSPAFKMLARVTAIMHQLIQAWDVLSTLTPSEYMEFRGQLGHSSGFQSYQYRAIEFLLGNKNRAMIAPHAHRPDIERWLTELLNAPSFYDEALRLMARRGLAIAPGVLDRDFALPREHDPSVEAAFLEIYRHAEAHFDLYQLAEELVDMEDYFRQWRFRHVTTVERVIGFKRGTGGTAGVGYLKGMLDLKLFPELWHVRTSL
jgi:tryptophan 2,3-dioxygenase